MTIAAFKYHSCEAHAVQLQAGFWTTHLGNHGSVRLSASAAFGVIYLKKCEGLSRGALMDPPKLALQSNAWCRHMNMQLCSYCLRAPCPLKRHDPKAIAAFKNHSCEADTSNIKFGTFGYTPCQRDDSVQLSASTAFSVRCLQIV